MQIDFILYFFIYLFILILSLLIIFFILFIKKLNYYLVYNKCKCNCNSNRDLIIKNLFDNGNKIKKNIQSQQIQFQPIQLTEPVYQSIEQPIMTNENLIKNEIAKLYQQLENNDVNINIDNYPFSLK